MESYPSFTEDVLCGLSSCSGLTGQEMRLWLWPLQRGMNKSVHFIVFLWNKTPTKIEVPAELCVTTI